jgi:hypothetical protein
MVYRYPHAAPRSLLPEERQGREIGRFCKVCGFIYPLHRLWHRGKPLYGRDHIAAPCPHEGERFEAGEAWWELAVEVLPEALEKHAEDLVAGAPVKGTAP